MLRLVWSSILTHDLKFELKANDTNMKRQQVLVELNFYELIRC